MSAPVSNNKKRLLIVGSAPLPNDQSAFIDASDCVVRFNNCKNYGGYAGYKTDILYLNNAGNPEQQRTLAFFLRSRTEDDIQRDLPYLSQLKQLYFARPPCHDIRAFLRPRINQGLRLVDHEYAMNAHHRDLASEILEALRFPKHRAAIIDTAFFHLVWKKLLRFGDTDAATPSTGILGFEHILSLSAYADYNIYFTGFNLSGWAGHPWALEAQLMRSYIPS